MATAAVSKPNLEVPNKGLLTVSLMLSTTMQMLDTTIANVALPHMQGSLSASQDQIAWVLTSYIVAAAIATPLSGWMGDRFGRKAVVQMAVAGLHPLLGACAAWRPACRRSWCSASSRVCSARR